MMEIEQLWREIDGRVTSLPVESVSLQDSNHRVLASDVAATTDQPAFDQSAMDGFAFASTHPGECKISDTVAAGASSSIQLHSGEAVRILTGGVVPRGTFAIEKQEDCVVTDGTVRLRDDMPLAKGKFIRPKAGIFRAGDVILERCKRITPGALALLASAGIAELDVVSRASCLHVITGDEIVPVGAPLPTGNTYDSNGPMLHALLTDAGVSSSAIALRDDPTRLTEVVSNCRTSIILISGGSGPGDRDHAKHALESSGFTIHTHRINSRPGGPLIFATRDGQVAFGLPGNPLSHWVCFHAFVGRMISRLHGQELSPLIIAEVSTEIPDTGDGRRTWTPAFLTSASGTWTATPLPWKHSGDLTPLVRANALILDGTSSTGTAAVLPIHL